MNFPTHPLARIKIAIPFMSCMIAKELTNTDADAKESPMMRNRFGVGLKYDLNDGNAIVLNLRLNICFADEPS